MSRRSSHTGKSVGQQEYYARQLDSYITDATVEEKPIFSVSDLPTPDENESEPTPPTQANRPKSLSEIFAPVINKDLLYIFLLSILTVIICIFLYNISNKVGYLEGVMGEIKDDVKSVKEQLLNVEDKIYKHDLELQKQGILIEGIEEELQDFE